MSKTGRISAVLLSSRSLMLLALGAAAAAGVAFLGSGSSHTVVAQFTDADGLVSGNEIRVAGLQTGGTVDSVQVQVLNGQQVAVAVLNVDDAHWPLHQGTTFAVRPKGVLSNVYVALAPGNANSPVLDAAHVFSTKETSSPIQLDAFSNLFTQDVRESIRTQIQEGVVAFGGAGADNTNGLLHNLNPLTADLSPVTAVLAQRSPELDRLNGEFDTITAQLAHEDSNLRGLIENGNTFLHAIAVNAQAVQGTLVLRRDRQPGGDLPQGPVEPRLLGQPRHHDQPGAVLRQPAHRQPRRAAQLLPERHRLADHGSRRRPDGAQQPDRRHPLPGRPALRHPLRRPAVEERTQQHRGLHHRTAGARS
jgi:phospholipid/cholesterol/gamma-HCH transport system substrate-binding protein